MPAQYAPFQKEGPKIYVQVEDNKSQAQNTSKKAETKEIQAHVYAQHHVFPCHPMYA